MVTTALQIRKDLLSPSPTIQDGMSRRLGHSQPHIELVAIAGAIRIDLAGPSHLTLPTIKRLINATHTHLSMLPCMSDTAQQDTTEKASEVVSVVIQWAMQRKAYKPLREHIEALCAALGIQPGSLGVFRVQMDVVGVYQCAA